MPPKKSLNPKPDKPNDVAPTIREIAKIPALKTEQNIGTEDFIQYLKETKKMKKIKMIEVQKEIDRERKQRKIEAKKKSEVQRALQQQVDELPSNTQLLQDLKHEESVEEYLDDDDDDDEYYDDELDIKYDAENAEQIKHPYLNKVWVLYAHPTFNIFTKILCVNNLLFILTHLVMLNLVTLDMEETFEPLFFYEITTFLNTVYIVECLIRIVVVPKSDMLSTSLAIFDAFTGIVYGCFNTDKLEFYRDPETLVLIASFRVYKLFRFIYLIKHDYEILFLRTLVKSTAGTMVVLLMAFLVLDLGFSTLLYVINLKTLTRYSDLGTCMYFVCTILATIGLGDIDLEGSAKAIALVLIILSPLTAVFPAAVIANDIDMLQEDDLVLDNELLNTSGTETTKATQTDNVNKMRLALIKTLDSLHQIYFSNEDVLNNDIKKRLLLQHQLLELRALVDAFKCGDYMAFSDIYHRYTDDVYGIILDEEDKQLLYFGPGRVGEIRFKIWKVYEKPQTPYEKTYVSISLVLTTLAMIATILQTMGYEGDVKRRVHYCPRTLNSIDVEPVYDIFFDDLDKMDRLFTIYIGWEYSLRLLCSPDMRAFITDGINIIDFYIFVPRFVAFMCYIVTAFTPTPNENRTITILSLLKVARLFKYAKYSPTMITLAQTVKYSMNELNSYFMFMFFGTASCGFVFYVVEHGNDESNIQTIAGGMLQALNIMTTVGLGLYKVASSVGLYVLSFFAINAVFLVGLPIGMFQSNFINIYNYVLFKKKVTVRKRIQLFLNFKEYTHLKDVALRDAFKVTVDMLKAVINAPTHSERVSKF